MRPILLSTKITMLAAAAALLLPAPEAAAAEWPEFRGPGGQGHAPAGDVADVPLEWSETSNIDWKVPVAGKGWSSPVIAGGTIWMTTAIDADASRPAAGRSLRLLGFDQEAGRQTHNITLFELDDAGKQHNKNSFASPTPVVAGDRIFVHFGRLGTAAVDRHTGEILWSTTLPAYEHVHGNGGSPVVWRELLIVNCDGTDRQYVVALDQRTGEVRWHQDRPKSNMAFATPLIIEFNGRAQLVSPGAHRAISYDPDTGEPLWFVEYGDGFSNVPRPVFAHGLIYICTGFYKPEVLAVRPDGRGNVTATHVVWRNGRGVPLTPSPIVVGGEIYFVSDNGILSCLDARTGQPLWQERLGSNFSASPLFAGGRLYWQSEDGITTVIAPGREFHKLASNTVDGVTFASLAASGRALYLRSATHLYRISVRSR